jgi:hypothetical protein
MPMYRFAAALVASALVVAALPSQTAWAGPNDVSVLGLDAADSESQVAFDLTEALRAELATRGKGTSKDITLLELKLTMGCDDGDMSCLAEGGKTLEAGELVFGSVKLVDAGYVVKLSRLDVTSGALTKEATLDITREDVASEASLATVAKRLADALYGSSSATPTPAGGAVTDGATQEPSEEPADDSSEPGTEPAEKPRSGSKGGLVWGRDPNPPTWKWVGLGVSGGLTLAALGAGIGTTVSVSRLEDDLRKEAEKSLTDDSDVNDVDPALVADICDAARVEPDPMNEPGAVTNADIVAVCNRGTSTAKAATSMWVLTGVFAVSTAAFTTLLFVRRDDRASAALRRRGVSFGAAPVRGGGVFVGGGFRF